MYNSNCFLMEDVLLLDILPEHSLLEPLDSPGMLFMYEPEMEDFEGKSLFFPLPDCQISPSSYGLDPSSEYFEASTSLAANNIGLDDDSESWSSTDLLPMLKDKDLFLFDSLETEPTLTQLNSDCLDDVSDVDQLEHWKFNLERRLSFNNGFSEYPLPVPFVSNMELSVPDCKSTGITSTCCSSSEPKKSIPTSTCVSTVESKQLSNNFTVGGGPADGKTLFDRVNNGDILQNVSTTKFEGSTSKSVYLIPVGIKTETPDWDGTTLNKDELCQLTQVHTFHDCSDFVHVVSNPAKRFKREVPDSRYLESQREGDTSSESENDSSDIENYRNDNNQSEKADKGKSSLRHCSTSKKYFWQYNTQFKGPKGARLCKNVSNFDPHILDSFEDPVFDPDQTESSLLHNGKARKGDGTDVTPNPYKLFQIGKELTELNSFIDCMVEPGDGSTSVRTSSLKEKNKFASRACRLKKKAQHEANKIKLHGLENEHSQLMDVLTNIKMKISYHVKHGTKCNDAKLSPALDSLVKSHLSDMIAGHTDEYVGSVLETVGLGDRTGGLVIEN